MEILWYIYIHILISGSMYICICRYYGRYTHILWIYYGIYIYTWITMDIFWDFKDTEELMVSIGLFLSESGGFKLHICGLNH